MNHLKHRLFATAIGLGLLASGQVWAQDKTPLRLGAVLRIGHEQGFKMRQMIEYMIEQKNAAGGVNGRKIDAVFYNEDCVPNTGIDAVTRAIEQDKAHLILGASCSGVTLAIVPIVARLETPQITGQSTASAITQQGSEWVFRTSVPDRYQAVALADYMAGDLGKKRIAVLHETEAMGAGFAKEFISHLKERYQLEPVVVERSTPTDPDFRAQLIKIKSQTPDALALFLHEAESARAIVQARAVGIDPSVVRAGASTLSSKEFPTLAANAADGVLFTGTFNPFDTRDDIKAYSKLVYDKWGLYPDQNYSQTTDAVNVLFQVLDKLDIDGSDAALKDDRRKIRDALTQVKDFHGLAGTTTFCAEASPECRDGNKDARIFKYEGGGADAKIVTVK